ncbi:nickel pincer cofactor biosynthesis protein LarC [Velocimicrobium porci]|uniref:LarC family nickel insertion protein n=1 Tax=Velocimicrobium porci TaxID=2606634 RepID=A0A6L5Y1S3_9FIRM|nr:LarC family nickel insertion protein [Velocimicrobium porci]MSS64874.1 LarC family nickel insertion protein [Velocimicrobium porci]
MKLLYLECNMGVAGDMLMGALLELLPDKEDFIKEINKIGIPNTKIEMSSSTKCGIVGTQMSVRIGEIEEESIETNNHHKHHTHLKMSDIEHIIDCLQIEETIKTDIKNIYHMIADAESRVHGKEVTEIHFHEVGRMDAIADITGCVMLLHKLGVEKVITSPINVGFGQVNCSHGMLPVPAPATAYMLEGIPCYAGQIEGELCTPTGIALVKYITKEYANMPGMIIEKIGYGMGKKDYRAVNCVRAILGKSDV